MASRLSSGAIVLDKLAARWVHVAVFILLGLPVIGLLTLFGGVAWDYVIGAYAGTFSIVFFTAALAVLTSTFARRVGQGVLIAYLLEIVWLVGPPIFDAACRWLFPGYYLWISPLCTWALGTSLGDFGLADSTDDGTIADDHDRDSSIPERGFLRNCVPDRLGLLGPGSAGGPRMAVQRIYPATDIDGFAFISSVRPNSRGAPRSRHSA